jgi:hypothetical protein
MSKISNILNKLKIWQITSNEERNKNGLKKLGRGFMDAERLNPYNPLSYVFFLIIFLYTLIFHGLSGVFKNFHNPFKWD